MPDFLTWISVKALSFIGMVILVAIVYAVIFKKDIGIPKPRKKDD